MPLPSNIPIPTSTYFIQLAKNNKVDAIRNLLMQLGVSPKDRGQGETSIKNESRRRGEHSRQNNKATNGDSSSNRNTGLNTFPSGYHFNIDCTDREDGVQRSALFWASSQHYTQLCRLLLDHGADPNKATTTTHTTPLHAAADNHSGDIVRMLLDRGADVCAKKTNGDTALHLAASRGDESVCRLLLQYGASSECTNTKQRTPSDEARANRHQHILALLKQHEEITGGIEPPHPRPTSESARTSGFEPVTSLNPPRRAPPLPSNFPRDISNKENGQTRTLSHLPSDHSRMSKQANKVPLPEDTSNNPLLLPCAHSDPSAERSCRRMGRLLGGEEDAVGGATNVVQPSKPHGAISSRSGSDSNRSCDSVVLVSSNRPHVQLRQTHSHAQSSSGTGMMTETAAHFGDPRNQSAKTGQTKAANRDSGLSLQYSPVVPAPGPRTAERYGYDSDRHVDVAYASSNHATCASCLGLPPQVSGDADDEVHDRCHVNSQFSDAKLREKDEGQRLSDTVQENKPSSFQARNSGSSESCKSESDDELSHFKTKRSSMHDCDALDSSTSSVPSLEPCYPPGYNPETHDGPQNGGHVYPHHQPQHIHQHARHHAHTQPQPQSQQGSGQHYTPVNLNQEGLSGKLHAKTLISATQGESREQKLFVQATDAHKPQGSRPPANHRSANTLLEAGNRKAKLLDGGGVGFGGHGDFPGNEDVSSHPLNLSEEISDQEYTLKYGQQQQQQKQKAWQSQRHLTARQERCEQCRYCSRHTAEMKRPASDSPPETPAAGASSSSRQQAQSLAQQFAPLAGETTHSNLYRTLLPIFKVMNADFRQAMTLTLRENLSPLWPVILLPSGGGNQQRELVSSKSTWLAGDFSVMEKMAGGGGGNNCCILKIVHNSEQYLMKIAPSPPPATPEPGGLQCVAQSLHAVRIGPSEHLAEWGVRLAAPEMAQLFPNLPVSLQKLLVSSPDLPQEFIQHVVYQVLHAVLSSSNNALSPAGLFFDANYRLQAIFADTQGSEDWQPLHSVWDAIIQYGRRRCMTSSFSAGLQFVLDRLKLTTDFGSLSKYLLSVGVLLFGPRQDEVHNETDCEIWLQCKMMKLLVQPPKPQRYPDDPAAVSIATSLDHIHMLLEMDFVTKVTGVQLWDTRKTVSQ